MKRFVLASLFTIGLAAACGDSPFFCPDPPPEMSCGWFTCQEVPTINPPAPPPVPSCGYGGSCNISVKPLVTIYIDQPATDDWEYWLQGSKRTPKF